LESSGSFGSKEVAKVRKVTLVNRVMYSNTRKVRGPEVQCEMKGAECEVRGAEVRGAGCGVRGAGWTCEVRCEVSAVTRGMRGARREMRDEGATCEGRGAGCGV